MKKHASDKGDSLLEFAFAVPILLVVVFGLLDLGRAYFSVIIITNAAREGARYLTLHPDDNQVDVYGNTFSGTKAAAIAETSGSIVSLSAADVSVFNCVDADIIDGCDSGLPIEVQVTYQFDLVMGWIMNGPLSISRSARMMVP